MLTPQSEEGPFFIDRHLLRSDIVAGRPGVPLELRLIVIDAASCMPMRDVRLDVWHADAQGIYSGYRDQGDGHAISTENQSFLRGTQITDEDGLVAFSTIYPGWYDGRAPHIHVKAFLTERNVLTGQIFLPDALSEFIYTNHAAYEGRKVPRETVNRNDHVVIGSDPEHLAFAAVKESPTTFSASLTLGIDRMATSSVRTAGPPPTKKEPTHVRLLEDRAKALLPRDRT